VPDDLARWAAKRAPDLLARAEAEAVEQLKRALVEASLQTRSEARRDPGKPRVTEPTPTRGDGLWSYCVTRIGEPAPERIPGVHEAGPVERIEHAQVAVLVSRVPLAEFGEEALRRNLNDLDWLEQVARSHEAVLERTLQRATIVPLRLCTIFDDEGGVRRMLDEQRSALLAALDLLSGHQEWGVKLLADRDALEAAARAQSSEADAEADEPAQRSAGGAYMLRRRMERRMREEADRLAVGVAEEVHARLQDWASDAVLNPPQNRDLSGHDGEMLLNGAYLVESSKVARLRELVGELQERHRELGVTLQLTGPWPPYNFVPRDPTTEGAALA
jgi:Gas vesicle synthesis protein GvpL/GvpF